MNSPAMPAFAPAMLQQARHDAMRSKRRLMQVLEENTGLQQPDFMHWLEELTQYEAISMLEMHACQPDFELFSFADCLKQECLPLRTPSAELLVVIADPFAEHLREWIWARLHQPFTFRIAHHSDLHACFARQE